MSDVAPLEAFTLLDRGSLEQARELAVGLLSNHSVRPRGRGVPRATVRAANVGSALSLMYVSYGMELDAVSEPIPDFTALQMPIRGRLRYNSGRDVHVAEAGDGAFASERETFECSFSEDLELLVLRINRAAVTRKLAAITGRPFTGTISLTHAVEREASGRSLIPAVTALRHVVERFGADGIPALLAAEYEELILSTIILDHPHSISAATREDASALSPRTLGVAIDYVRQHYMEPLTVTMIAQAAHVSQRTLQNGFQREFGVSPMGYVRRCRLEHVREALIAGRSNPDVTVTDVALAHGFGHVGRFAAIYRARYGESPSDTLHR